MEGRVIAGVHGVTVSVHTQHAVGDTCIAKERAVMVVAGSIQGRKTAGALLELILCNQVCNTGWRNCANR